MERQVLRWQRRAPWVGVQQQQRLVVTFNAARNHVPPSRPNLQMMDRKGEHAIVGVGQAPPTPAEGR